MLAYILYIYVCMQLGTCGGVSVHVCAYAYEDMRLMLGIFLIILPPFSMRQRLSVNPELPTTASPSGQLALGIPCPYIQG